MRKIIALISVLLALQCHAQDFSLSQFHNLTALLNPASVGNFPDQYRVSVGHKRQWGSLTNPFVTNVFSAEGTLAKKRNQNHLTFGLLAITDKAGRSGYESSTYRALSAYRFQLNRTKSLSFGLEIGYNQRKFSLDGLAWDSQFNGAGYDPSLPSNEFYANTNTGDLDFGFGAEYKNENLRKLYWYAGLGVHHYYQQRSVLESGNDPYPVLAQLYWIGQQSNGYFMWKYYTLIQSQNLTAALSGSVGGELFYRFDYDSKFTNFSSSSALSGGVLYRFNDAISVLAGYEYKRIFKISISYDVTVSSLSRSNYFNGGPEIHFTYLGNFKTTRRRIK